MEGLEVEGGFWLVCMSSRAVMCGLAHLADGVEMEMGLWSCVSDA